MLNTFHEQRQCEQVDFEEFDKWWRESWLGELLWYGTVIIGFHEGVRKGDFNLVNSCCNIFMPMWWTASHTIYRLSMSSFLCDYLLMPLQLQEQMGKWLIGSNTGNEGKGQGLDYVGEEKIKLILSFLGPDPTYKDWVEAVHCLPLYTKICEEFEKETKKKTFNGRVETDHSLDVFPWLAVL